MAGNGVQLDPLINPLHAVLIIGFGVIYWSIATGVRTAAQNMDKIVEMSRHNPWFILFHKRSMTEDEAARRLPPIFWTVYGAMGLGGQVIGHCIMSGGSVALIILLLRKLF